MSKQLNDLLNDDTQEQPASGQLEKQRRMESEMAALFAYLDDTVKEWGEKNVYRWIDEWFIREIND